ncbi:SusC/RagA family TonB-linked outer membrane protein [Flavihumibacter sp. CACIAM 22H1]|uniref:SusC/RagA family TonB-linked outer membrane protein n=1 Tax=Flavihumibacter sp. CACIAM 22H1 TaxID=1812911 RepID=UPI0007A7E375|nr:SusC/RagA family TonB-linked outer membrane protein [Flavihumibacter sp. CACIAM 22H1]KYP14155.1 MAG: hypothetical protein A1D16_07330 [Flavihumibacter sp. CACIAM 22H1]
MRSKCLIAFLCLFVFIGQSIAQDKEVTGLVMDAKGEPLSNANILVKGTRVGTSTDATGKFRLLVPNNARILVISSVNFRPREVAITGQPLQVQLESSTDNLSEVVVVAYGSQKKPEVTGSISTVKAADIENRPFTSIDKALQGAVPGLQSVAASGAPGSIQQIRLRGIGSINASSEPLWVIDGIPVNTGDASRATTSANLLSTLNPNDIESISVLKDASASSVYGSRAANGVILVTTKKGKAGKTKFRLDMEGGQNDVAYFNDNYRALNAEEYFNLTREGLINAGIATPANVDGIMASNFGFGNGVDFNWLDATLRKSSQQQVNLSASGGNDRTTFNVSGGYFRQDGISIQSSFKRYNGAISLVNKATDRLTISTNITAGFVNQSTPLAGGAFGNPILTSYFLLPSRAARKADGSLNITAPDFGPGALFNTVATAELDKRSLKQLGVRGGLSAEYKILQHLKFISRIGTDYNVLEENNYENPFHGDGLNTNGRGFSLYTRIFNYTWSNLLDYQQSLNADKDINLNLQVGYEAQDSRTFQSSIQAEGFPATTALTLPVVAATPITASATGSDYSFASAFSVMNFNYKDRFVVSGSFRRDGSSRFGINNRFGNFWSAGISWNLDRETFVQAIEWIDQAKLRASYGTNGNASIGNYDWQPTYGFGFNYNQQPGSAPNTIGNLDLTWELNKPLNIGIDLAFLNNRVSLNADYYIRKTTDLLLDAPLSRTSGFSTIRGNYGSMENKGIEINLGLVPVRTKNFEWSLAVNYAHNRNKILQTVNNQDILAGIFIRRPNEDFQSFYVRLWAGVDPANGDPLWYTDATKKETTNNWNAAQRAVFGSATPKYFGSINNSLRFRGITLDAQFYYNAGNYMQDVWAGFYMGSGNGGAFNKVLRQYEDRWKQPGDQAALPKYIYGGNKLAQNASTLYLYKADYIRLRDITLSYQLPVSVLKPIGLSSANFYVRGTNLWTWVRDKDLPWDPEQGVSSQTNLNIFIPKSLTVGLNLGF